MAIQKFPAFLTAALILCILLAACGAAAESTGPERLERGIVGTDFGGAESAAAMPQAAMARDDAGRAGFFNADTAAMATPAPMPAAGMVESAAMDGSEAGGQGSRQETGQTIDRKIIATATLTVEADSVERATVSQWRMPPLVENPVDGSPPASRRQR